MKGKYETECVKCGDVFEYDSLYQLKRMSGAHHTARKRNDRDKKKMLCAGCHKWAHDNPIEARELGLYDKIDSVYRKKLSPRSKWKLKKSYQSSEE